MTVFYIEFCMVSFPFVIYLLFDSVGEHYHINESSFITRNHTFKLFLCICFCVI